ncbi:hypothetical protein JM946_07370 [Steroidobacter sp. S1-65]|uniref:Uncharacterized protein n=1 Tax=Steroidobacter gossypii TaxID=2805490 RepID=A0ABS1WUB3_9GAMM|nr:hypothetical protein [Steroidobacter gossypii]MBM0104561.1 hypothetical protein [Steroidobacter gossypii]
MDEYLFMTLAKLKADRLKLEREARRAEPDPEQLRLQWAEPEPRRAPASHPVRQSLLARWFSQQPLWREQS